MCPLLMQGLRFDMVDITGITLVHKPKDFGIHRGVDANSEVDFGLSRNYLI